MVLRKKIQNFHFQNFKILIFFAKRRKTVKEVIYLEKKFLVTKISKIVTSTRCSITGWQPALFVVHFTTKRVMTRL